jgi:hypothetical protein
MTVYFSKLDAHLQKRIIWMTVYFSKLDAHMLSPLYLGARVLVQHETHLTT